MASLLTTLSDRQVSSESKVENTYNVTGCDRNYSLRSVTFIAAHKLSYSCCGTGPQDSLVLNS